jgi:nitroreductase
MTVSELIRTKRAVRQFTDEPLSEEAIRSILNAGRRAQSSKNSQPWHFIALRDHETLRQLSQCGAYSEKAKAILGVPHELHFDVAISFGYPLTSREQSHTPKSNGRKPFEEVIFWERWGG